MNSNTIMNTSYSGEEVEHDISFLKGGTFTKLWNAIFNYEDAGNVHEQKHR